MDFVSYEQQQAVMGKYRNKGQLHLRPKKTIVGHKVQIRENKIV
jgi:hypothetical protein